jgi:hypothetical protein
MASLDLTGWRRRLRRRLRDDTRAAFPDELLDEVAEGAMAELYPVYYRIVYSANVTTDTAGFVAVPVGQYVDHVFDIEDAAEKGTSTSLPWFKRGSELGGLDPSTAYVVVSHEPFPVPTSTAYTIPDTALDRALTYAAGLVAENMVFEKARWKNWEPSDPDRVDENELLNLADMYFTKFTRMMGEGAGMSLPGLAV